jgi:predicted Zn-dependent protease
MSAAVSLRTIFPAAILAGAPAGAEVAALSEYARGVFAELQGDRKSARTHFETTLAADPDSFMVVRRAAKSQLATKDLNAASGTLRTFARQHPAHLGAQLHYTDFLEQHARGDAAALQVSIDLLENANERFPHEPELYARLINQYENAETRDKSLALFRAQFEAPEAGPAHWMALAPIARTLLPGNSEELADRLDTIARRTIETGIASPAAARMVSDYYRTTNRLNEAIAVLEQHIGKAPDSLELRARLGLLLFYAKREEDGERALRDTLAIDADQILAHKGLAKFYERRGDLDRSLHHRAEILRVNGGTPSGFLEIANIYLDNDQPHPARLLLEKARFEHPEDPGIAARLAIASLRDGDTTAAARLFRQAESLARDSRDPDAARFLDADFQLEFAVSLREAGDVAAAEDRLRNAARSIPEDQPEKTARALRELARLWLDQDRNHGPAAALLKRAESLEPGNPATRTLLERARKK